MKASCPQLTFVSIRFVITALVLTAFCFISPMFIQLSFQHEEFSLHAAMQCSCRRSICNGCGGSFALENSRTGRISYLTQDFGRCTKLSNWRTREICRIELNISFKEKTNYSYSDFISPRRLFDVCVKWNESSVPFLSHFSA